MRLEESNPVRAKEVTTTIEEFSVRKDPIDPTITHKVEVTTGFRLLGTPVGSPDYALEFFNANVMALNIGFCI